MFREALFAPGRFLFAPILPHYFDRTDRDLQTQPAQRRTGRRPATLATLFGEVSVVRDYHLVERVPEESGHCPTDAAMGLEGRQGKLADGTSRIREVKLGGVFTQHRADGDGLPERDLDSTTYVSSYQTSVEFSLRLLAEARRRGPGAARQVAFISDGAVWKEDIATKCFPGSTSILNFYHASERIHELAQGLGVKGSKQRTADWKEKLLADGVGEVIVEARRLQEQEAPTKRR